MSEETFQPSSQSDLPIWAQPDAFPKAPGGFGWMDSKLVPHPCNSLTEIAELIQSRKGQDIALVWTPDSDYCRLPEEIPALAKPIFEARIEQVKNDHVQSKTRLWLCSIALGVVLIFIASHYLRDLLQIQKACGIETSFMEATTWLLFQLASSVPVGVFLLIYLTVALIPWYQAQKDQREINENASDPSSIIPVLKFETWLSFQKAPFTKLVFISISLVFASQLLGDQSMFQFQKSIQHAGLVKPAYDDGEYWRLFTAPMLHGGILHFAMNALALLYLGKRMEVFARWPHIPTVFLVSAIIGGLASNHFTPATSVGASGGLMGWLGFLLIFETLHHRLVPRSARRRLLAGLFMTALFGLIGYRFIDNAAHFGGLIAGMAYALIVFPKSNSPLRPNILLMDRFVGSICLVLIFLSSALAVFKVLS